MSIFSRRPQFTGQEVTHMILLAASIESLEQIGLNPDPKMEAAIAKAKAICIRTDTDDGFNIYCPPISIVGG